jgi:hypothetical protein
MIGRMSRLKLMRLVSSDPHRTPAAQESAARQTQGRMKQFPSRYAECMLIIPFSDLPEGSHDGQFLHGTAGRLHAIPPVDLTDL